MLIEQCPHCQQVLQLRDRLVFIYKFYGTCKHCQQDFLPKNGPMVWSSGVIGSITGVLATAILKLDFYFPEITIMAKASILAISAFVAYLSFSKLIFAKR